MAAKVILDAADIVGESIVYDDRRGTLLWVDIGGKRIHRLSLSDHRHELWPALDFPTSIGLRADGGAIVGLRDRVALLIAESVSRLGPPGEEGPMAV